MRLDQYMVSAGLAPSRTRAQAMIVDGRVFVNGRAAEKPSQSVEPDAAVTVQPDSRDDFVGRGSGKLLEALRVFGPKTEDCVAADLGASTGGFTEVLLRAGARHVFAVDVGEGQLHPRLRGNPRVTVMEHTNARTLTPDRLGSLCDAVVMDVSFISQRLLYGAASSLLKPDGWMITLVKPQFEAGRADIGKHGVVHDRTVHLRVVRELIGAAREYGLYTHGFCRSPYPGGDGNTEYLLYLQKTPAEAPDNEILRGVIDAPWNEQIH